jgi:hypothetical protein
MESSVPANKKKITDWNDLRASGQDPLFFEKNQVRNFLKFQKAFFGKLLYAVL